VLTEFIKGIGQLSDKATRSIVWISLGTAVATFACLWTALGVLLHATAFFGTGWLETLVDALGAAAVLPLTWFLFPAVVSAVAGLFLERAAALVEAKHYPDLEPASGLSLSRSMLESLKFLGVFIFIYTATLPLLLFLPPVFPLVFYPVAGYLLGREYFELVAFRRMTPGEARALRKAHATSIFLTGLLTAFLMTIPVANLLMPLVATATMVHLLESWRKEADTPAIKTEFTAFNKRL